MLTFSEAEVELLSSPINLKMFQPNFLPFSCYLGAVSEEVESKYRLFFQGKQLAWMIFYFKSCLYKIGLNVSTILAQKLIVLTVDFKEKINK